MPPLASLSIEHVGSNAHKHVAGFEPAMNGVADRRLKPAWLHVRESWGAVQELNPASEPFVATRFCSVKLTAL